MRTIRFQKLSFCTNSTVDLILNTVLKGKKRNNFREIGKNSHFEKEGVYKVQGFENFSESGCL